MGLNNLEVKRLNRNNLLRYMLKRDQISKSSAATALGLSIPTVTQCLNELVEMGLAQEAGMLQSIGGRKSTGFSCERNKKVAVGVDITRYHINIVVINLSMELLYSRRYNVKLYDTAESYEELRQIIMDAIQESGVSESMILGMGVSLPAIIDETGLRIKAMHEKMKISYRLPEIMKEWFDFPIRFQNDANSAGYAEIQVGELTGDAVYFFISPSVGGALIIDGKIIYGINGRTGEFGHITLIPDGEECYCGRKGCVNAYCSTDLLSAFTDGNLEEFFRELRINKTELAEYWDQYLGYLAMAIHNLVETFDMDIIIGGYIGQHIAPYLNDLRERVRKLNPYLTSMEFIRAGLLKYEASAIGVAEIFVDEYLATI